MSKLRTYLAGAMTCFSEDPWEATQWRDDLSGLLKEHYIVINPAYQFTHEDMDEREAMNWDLYNVRKSDFIIVNFNGTSLGTMAEIATAYELKIPIIGLNEDARPLHPWEKLMTERIFSNREDMLSYIITNYQ